MIFRYLYLSFLLAVLWLFSFPSLANTTLVQSLQNVQKGNQNAALSARSSLNGAARETLDWYLFSKGLGSGTEAIKFLSAHESWPYSNTIQKLAEEKLQGTVLDASMVSYFDKNAPLTAQGMMLYGNALLAQGQSSKFQTKLNEWWTQTTLSRDEQKNIYNNFGKYINTVSHAKRLDYLLDKEQYTNATAIADVLGGGHKALANARIALGQGKGDVNSLINSVPAQLQNNEGLLFDRLQWRRKKNANEGALEILRIAPPAHQTRDPERWWKERHIMVRRLMEARQYQAAYKLAAAHQLKEGFPHTEAEWISGYLALRKINQPGLAFQHFERLYKTVETPISKSRGAYWAGRASDSLNRPDVGAQWYAVAARYPETFYGQLAAEKIGKKAILNMQASTGGSGYASSSMAQAATWLAEAGLVNESSAFLLRMNDKASTAAEFEGIARLADRLGQPQIAIKVAQELQKKHGTALGQYLYPYKTKELQNVSGVEWAFVNAIIRQESRFEQNAVSHAGARGLMQLMPATANQTASKKGISHQTAWLTSRPAHNITLGSAYLGQMVNRFNGSYALAAAAYNAGPGRVDGWLKENGDLRNGRVDIIDWIEDIPIYETRNYVQRVLEGVYVYRNALKGKQPAVQYPIHVATN